MGDEKQPKTKLSVFFKEAVWTFILVLILELFEEVLEEAIAVGFVWLIQKTVSALLVVTLTQTVKLFLKRIIKMITYKEGNDKMKLFKNYFILMWGNKITGTSAGVLGAGLVWFQTLLPQFAGIWYFALAGFIVCYNFAALFGGEYLSQILDRIANKSLKKEEYAKIKETEAKAKEIAKKVDEEFKKLQVENDARLRAEAEAKVLAEQSTETEIIVN